MKPPWPPAQPAKPHGFHKSFRKFSIYISIDLRLSYLKMLVIFLHLIMDFCFCFSEKQVLLGYILVVWSFVYFSWKKSFQKKYFSIIFHSFNMKNYWKIFFLEHFFFTWNRQMIKHTLYCIPQKDLFSGKKKKKNPLLKKLQAFSGNSTSSL